MPHNRWIAAIFAVFMVGWLRGGGAAYELSGARWPGTRVGIHSSGSSTSYWNDAYVQAVNQWNNLSDFTFQPVTGYQDPCADPNAYGPPWFTGWAWRYDQCGERFGSGVLAVNIRWTIGRSIVQAGTVFNANLAWDVHHGPGSRYFDFRRVAAHELGHALGLEHENIQPALMNPFYSQTIETPQADDIDGLRALYGGAAGSVPVYRFWNAGSGHHFYTIRQDEKNSLISYDPGMNYEGIAWHAYPNQQPETVPVHRFFSDTLGYHFYTAGESEKDHLICCDPAWRYEGIAWYVYPAPRSDAVPVYRFRGAIANGHFYTAGEAEKDHLICCDPNWIYEGIAYYAVPE